MVRKLRLWDREGISAFSHALLLGAQFQIEECLRAVKSDLSTDKVRNLSDFCNTLADSLEASAIKSPELNQAPRDDPEVTPEHLPKITAWLASLTIDHFDLSEPVSKLEMTCASASLIERETPLACLPDSDLLESLRSLVCKKLFRLAARDLGIDIAQAKFIGLGGLLVLRQRQSPPDWNTWDSSVARKTREERGWANELLHIGLRQVFGPVRRAHFSQFESHNYVKTAEKLVEQTNENGPNDKLMFDRLWSLGDRLCKDDAVSKLAIEKSFPSYGAMEEQHNYHADADPSNFLVFLSAQFAWRGVLEGWVICLAQDGVDEPTFSWIPKEEFPKLSDSGELVLPSEINVKSCFDLDELAREKCSANRLWFVLLQDLIAAMEETPLASATAPTRRYNSGLDSTDEKFVEEGFHMVQSGLAKSALNAAEQLVAKYDIVLLNKQHSKPEAILTTSVDNTVSRLQKKISKRLRRQLPN